MEQKQLVQIPVQVDGMKSLADKSWKISFQTRELDGADLDILSSNLDGEGWLVFSPNEITREALPTEEAESGAKTPSQRLRSVIYIWWKQRGSEGDFEAYYRKVLGDLVENIKSKLEDE